MPHPPAGVTATPLTPEARAPFPWGSLGMLAICVGVLAAGAVVEVSPERAHFHGVEGPKCWIRGALGDAACPGCGLTRSTALVLQGEWGAAWRLHAGGFVVVFLCLAGIPWYLWIVRRGTPSAGVRRWGTVARALLLAAVVVPWLLGRITAE